MEHPGVSQAKLKALQERMQKLSIREGDVLEKFIRARGRGGQKVNKTSTAVYVKHIPTGTEVKCDRSRQQVVNRFLARRILADKIEKILKGELSEEKKRIAKIRRQKMKRTRRAKEKMLAAKKKHSEKKKTRSFRPSPQDLSA